MHYHVITSFPGCLPEANYVFDTLKEAKRYIINEANDYRYAGYCVNGSSKDGYWVQYDKDSMGGFTLTIERCNDSQCKENEDEDLYIAIPISGVC